MLPTECRISKYKSAVHLSDESGMACRAECKKRAFPFVPQGMQRDERAIPGESMISLHFFCCTIAVSGQDPFGVFRASLFGAMGANDAAEPFGGPAARGGDGGEGPNRKPSLKDVESKAAVMFKAWESSTPQTHQPKELWKYMSEGKKFIEYHLELAAAQGNFEHHSELAATADTAGDYRAGVLLSRHARLLVKTIERLKEDQVLKNLIVKGELEKAMAEANYLLPHLKNLRFDKGSLTNDDVNESVKQKNKRARTEEAASLASEEDIEKAVKVLFDWLMSESSALRGLLASLFLVTYAAMAGERTLRVWAEAGGATAESATRAAKAVRMARMGSAEPTSSRTAASTKKDTNVLTGK